VQEDANTTGFQGTEAANSASSNTRTKSEIVGLTREGPWIVWPLLEQFGQDLRYSVRMLRRSPTFASVAVLVLALGIGANTAVFSAISALLLRPLPYENPERLAWIWGNNNQLGVNQGYLSTPDVFAFQQRSSSLESIAAWTTFPRNLVDKDVPERLEGILVTPNFFACLGVRIDLGRDFLPEEVLEGHDEVAIISDALWRRRFGSDPNVVGMRLRFNRGDSNGVLVVGVAPSEVQFPAHADIWMPGVDLSSNFEQGSRDLRAVARLKPGSTMEQAQSELNILAQSLEQEYPATNVGWRVSLTPVRDLVLGTPVKALWLLLGAVICVLLIACANVASLQLARSVSRSREIMLRVAIGASRIRVVRQLLTESFLLAVIGGATGLLLVWWGVAGLRAVGPATISRLGEAEVNGKVLVFTAVVTLLVSIASGLLPALQASRIDLMEALKASPRGSTRSVGRTRMRSLLVAVEVAAATLLLIAAGLLLKSFWRLQGVDPGFNADHMLTAGISLDLYFMNSDERRTGIFTQVLERVRGLPDVESVGMISHLPFGGRGVNLGFVLPGEQVGSEMRDLKAELRVISPDYFKAMSIPVKSGRAFTDQDTKAAPRVLLVNEAFARLFFHSRSPIGQRLQISFGSPFNGEIIGIAGDVRHRGYDADPRPEMYLSYLQNTLWPVMNLVVRTRGDPGVIAPVVRREIEAVDRSQAVFNVRPLDGMLSDSIAGRRFNVLLILSFSLVAVLTAAVGLYGLMSYLVTQQAADLGIRMALGARSQDVLRFILGHGMKLTGIGVSAGLFSGAFVTRLIASLLFGVSPLDPVAFVGVAFLLILVSLIACSVPALKASRIDPLIVIREQ
jgi:putative ABC transport system permease protein